MFDMEEYITTRFQGPSQKDIQLAEFGGVIVRICKPTDVSFSVTVVVFVQIISGGKFLLPTLTA